jgi:hypothetical protein
MFASEAVTHSLWDYNDLSSIRQCDLGESDLWEEMGGQVWKEAPSSVHASLEDDALHEYVHKLRLNEDTDKVDWRMIYSTRSSL